MSINCSPGVLYISGNKVPGSNVMVDKEEGKLDVEMSFFIRRAYTFPQKNIEKRKYLY